MAKCINAVAVSYSCRWYHTPPFIGGGRREGSKRERESDIDRSINSYILYGWSEVCGCGSSFVAFFCRFFILSHRFDATFILKKAKALARSTHFKRFYLCYLQSMCIESQVASSHSVPKEDEAEIGENKFFFAPIILYCDTIFRYLFQQRRWTFPIFLYTLRKGTESPYWDTSNEKKERAKERKKRKRSNHRNLSISLQTLIAQQYTPITGKQDSLNSIQSGILYIQLVLCDTNQSHTQT